MLLSFLLFILIIFCDIETKKVARRHVPNCVEPLEPEEVYNLEGWIGQLHLQQCTFVAMGENFFGIFLEKFPRVYDENQEIKEYFLGICDYKTLKKWNLCPLALEAKRKEDCAFHEDSQESPRVHRRLCELSDITQFGEHCNCDSTLRGDPLLQVVGFPTCFRSEITETVCGYNNVCGLNTCTMNMVSNRVYMVKCDENCFGHKPFCEDPEWETGNVREINSFWTDWSEAKCADSDCMAQYNEANCINKDTGLGDVDCLGPGSSCCAGDLVDCKCHVFNEEGMSKVIRTFTVPLEQEYDELSLDEIIKNLPVKNEHRQYKSKEKSKTKQKVSRRESLSFPLTYDDSYQHAYNIKLIKDDIHAKVKNREEQNNEREWIHKKLGNYTKNIRPENLVEPKKINRDQLGKKKKGRGQTGRVFRR
nr:uncharacterized protein LOC111421632 [Onthophagus taurus]